MSLIFYEREATLATLQRILIISDAWRPQTNGVVTTLSQIQNELEQTGHPTFVIGPDQFQTLPCPIYPEISLALNAGKKLTTLIDTTWKVNLGMLRAASIQAGINRSRTCS